MNSKYLLNRLTKLKLAKIFKISIYNTLKWSILKIQRKKIQNLKFQNKKFILKVKFQVRNLKNGWQLHIPPCVESSADSKSSKKSDLPAETKPKPLKRTIQIRTKPGSYLPGNKNRPPLRFYKIVRWRWFKCILMHCWWFLAMTSVMTIVLTMS